MLLSNQLKIPINRNKYIYILKVLDLLNEMQTLLPSMIERQTNT